MKKLKKFFCFFLLITLSLYLVGCSASSKETDPKKVLENAQKKNSEMTSSDLTMKLDMDIDAAGQAFAVGMELNCKTTGGTDATQMAMTGTINSMGVSLPLEMYYKDNYMYLNLMNQKMKQEIPLDSIQNQVIPSTETFSLSADDYKTINMTENGSDQIITFTADGEKMTDFVNTILSSLKYQLGGDVTYSMQNITGSITINSDGYLTEETIKMPMTITVPEVGDMNMDMTCTMTVHNPGKDEVTIEFPDFSDYVESDLSSAV